MEFLTGCEISDAAESLFPIIKYFKVFRDSESCAGSAGESVAVIHFIFQGREVQFRDRIVPAGHILPTLCVTSIVVQYLVKPDDAY